MGLMGTYRVYSMEEWVTNLREEIVNGNYKMGFFLRVLISQILNKVIWFKKFRTRLYTCAFV